jgi:hypothetical protein
MGAVKPRGHFKSGEPFAEPAAEKRERERLASAFRPAPRCAVCQHPERIRIEALHVAGATLDKLAKQFGLHRDQIYRHCKNHISDETKASYLLGPAKISDLANAAADESRSVIDYLTVVRSILMSSLDASARAGKIYEIDRLSGRMIEVMHAIGKITGEIRDFAGNVINVQNNVQILNSAPFIDLQTGLIEVCSRHPEARSDIVALLRSLDERHAAPTPKLIEHAEAAR